MPAIPVIDLSALATRRTDVVATTLAAYRDVGFAYLEGHDVSDELVAQAFAGSQRFHAQPVEEKLRLQVNRWHRGYLPLAESKIVASTIEKATKPNRSESLMIMHEVAPGDPARADDPFAGPNQWPELEGFRSVVEAYERELRRVAHTLVDVFGEALALPPERLRERFAPPTTFLRLLHYPPQAPDAAGDEFGSAPHTDYGFVTILAQDDAGGLQVRTADGSAWIDVPPRPGAFVLNVGDVGQRWSNGLLRSTPHRVVNRTGRDRYSIPYFFDPGAGADIGPFPECVGSGEPRFASETYGAYVTAKLDANHSYRAERGELQARETP
ncbi:MAG: 2OG-Fe(II) oxygenase family protein [Gaiellales bacterium]